MELCRYIKTITYKKILHSKYTLNSMAEFVKKPLQTAGAFI
jgi:hypothetical protein